MEFRVAKGFEGSRKRLFKGIFFLIGVFLLLFSGGIFTDDVYAVITDVAQGKSVTVVGGSGTASVLTDGGVYCSNDPANASIPGATFDSNAAYYYQLANCNSSGQPMNTVITIDLAGVYTITSYQLYALDGNYQIGNYNIYYSNDGTNYNLYENNVISSWTNGYSGYYGKNINITGRYIRFAVNNSYWYGPWLSEIKLNGVSALSTNNNLTNLVPSTGSLSPGFASGTTSYTLDVANSTTTIKFTPTVEDSTATVTVNGQACTSGSQSQQINLNVGSNSIPIVVTAQDTSTKTYTIIVNRYENAITFKYDNFSNANLNSLLQTGTDASITGGVARITPSSAGKAGSVFYKNKVQLGSDRSFSTCFSFNINTLGGGGADGFVFIVNTNTNSLGSSGGGLGYGGINNSLGVEFDTYNNGASDNNSGNHIAINTNGEMTTPVALSEAPYNMKSGSTYYVWIDYNGSTHTLEVRMSDTSTRPAGTVISQNIDIGSIFGSDDIYVGFTGATGGSYENHDISKWYFDSKLNNLYPALYTYPIAPTTIDLAVTGTGHSKTLTATVKDYNGNAVGAGESVTFSVASGSATLGTASATTNGSGQASTTVDYTSSVAPVIRAVISSGAYSQTTVALNSAPTITSFNKYGTLNTTLAFTAASFTSNYSDADTDALNSIKITTLPANGTLKLSGVDITQNQVIAAADLGNITFVPNTDWWNGTDTITWTAYDGYEYSAGANITLAFCDLLYSSVYTVNNTTNKITEVSSGTPYATFISNISTQPGSTTTVYLSDGVTVVSNGNITSGMKVKVVGYDATQKTFSILLAGITTLTSSGNSPEFYSGASSVEVDSNLILTGTENIDGARVYITDGFNSAQDRLVFTDMLGITGSYNTSSGILTLSGNTTTANYQTALRSVKYNNLSSTPNVTTRKIVFTIGTNILYYSDTGHYYEYVASSGITWTNAKTAAEARLYYGLGGYLVTITSSGENTFVASKCLGDGWLGATDAGHDKEWYWVTGPEGAANGGTGTKFCTQNPVGSGGAGILSTEAGMYQNFASGEPNDWSNGAANNENYAHMYSASGTWNDYPNSVGSIAGYLVEYGGGAFGDPSIFSLTFSKDMIVHQGLTALSIAVNNSDASTESISVTLNLGATGAAQMRFSNDNTTWSDWEAYAVTKSWTLTSGAGTKTVYVMYKDAGNNTQTVNDTILYNHYPVVSTIRKDGSQNVSVSFQQSDFLYVFSDSDSGDTLDRIKITSLPENGTLNLNASSVVVNQVIVLGELNTLSFEPSSSWRGTTTFNWKGSDGKQYSLTDGTVSITIASSGYSVDLVNNNTNTNTNNNNNNDNTNSNNNNNDTNNNNDDSSNNNVNNSSNSDNTNNSNNVTTGGVDVLVNGKTETAATETTTKQGDNTVTTVTVDDSKIEAKLNSEGNNSTVTIPIDNNSDIVVGQLNGQTVKNMEQKEAVLEIKTENVTYTLPAQEINIDNVSEQIGQQVALKDIKINITIAEPPANTVKIVEDTANRNNYQVVVKPVDFEITCSNRDKTVEVSKFNGYIERTVAIPDGIDPSKITTGIVLNSDGTFSHVPTNIIVIDGKYYAKINSLTNSTYSVIYNHKTFGDIEKHWAKNDINDMASRLVIDGVDNGKFEPNRSITRAEFATIVVKGLGLMRPNTGKDVYKDVSKTAWYYDSVSIASDYKLIEGYGDGNFKPTQNITREEAIAVISRAMVIAKMNVNLSEDEIKLQLSKFTDSSTISKWARGYTAVCIKNEIIFGDNSKVSAKENITRAQVAAIVRRMLKGAKLI